MVERKKTRGRILVVEDEAYVRESLGEILVSRGYDTTLAASLDAALDALARAPIDAVLTDLRMPGGDGLELTKRASALFPEIPILIFTGFGTIASAVECVRAGASDYILKPADPDALDAALKRSLTTRTLRREVAYLRSATGSATPPQPIGASRAWLDVIKKIRAAAASDATILILGESGTGKEVLARLAHALSPRAAAPYVRVNCAAVPMEMWESEFFGHRKGSYTGATADREGRFRLADRGTLFMDEIGTMPLAAQAKILRVLQDGEFDRLGDEQPTRVDVRVIAATNSDIDAEVAAGRFRQDLFYRINVVRIEVPTLRNRPEDIALLAAKFAGDIASRLGRPVPMLTKEILEDLAAYSWPGNVRELRNVIERAIILSPGDSLASLDLPPVERMGVRAADVVDLTGAAELNLRAVLAVREKEVVVEALKRSAGVRKEASRLLGIDQRNLGYYLKKHGIDPDRPDL